jgi:hypothetical protein
MGVQGNAGSFSEGADLLYRPMKMRTGFGMDGDHICARVGERLNIFLGLDDHQMNIDHTFGSGSDSLHHEGPDGDVGHESAVHDIDVDPVRPGFVDSFDFSRKAAKIRRKDGGGDSKGLLRSRHGSSQAPQSEPVNDIRSVTLMAPTIDNMRKPLGKAYGRG